jgi:hypothetical protein
MTQDRHDEMVAVVNGLNAIGIPTLGVDMFNRFGGATFNNDFTIDGTHPNSKADARYAWGENGFYGIMVEASEDPGNTGNRSRDRSRTR